MHTRNWKSKVPPEQIPSFHGTGLSTCYAPGSVTGVRHHSSPAQNMPAPFLSPKKTPKPLARLSGPHDLAPLTSPSQLLAFPPFTPLTPPNLL